MRLFSKKSPEGSDPFKVAMTQMLLAWIITVGLVLAIGAMAIAGLISPPALGYMMLGTFAVFILALTRTLNVATVRIRGK